MLKENKRESMRQHKQRIVLLMDENYNPTLYVSDPDSVELIVLNQDLEGADAKEPTRKVRGKDTMVETGWVHSLRKLDVRTNNSVDTLLNLKKQRIGDAMLR